MEDKLHRHAIQAEKFFSSRTFESKGLVQVEFVISVRVRVLAARNSVFTAYALKRRVLVPSSLPGSKS